MNNDTTVTSNDESRKKATDIKVANTNELKTNYVSDEEVKNDIKNKWGEELYVAAIDAEFIENIINQEEANSSSATDGGQSRRKKVKVTSKVAFSLKYLIENAFITVSAKDEKGKFDKARKEKNAKKQENKKDEKEME